MVPADRDLDGVQWRLVTANAGTAGSRAGRKPRFVFIDDLHLAEGVRPSRPAADILSELLEHVAGSAGADARSSCSRRRMGGAGARPGRAARG
jgi:hypothetical protein